MKQLVLSIYNDPIYHQTGFIISVEHDNNGKPLRPGETYHQTIDDSFLIPKTTNSESINPKSISPESFLPISQLLLNPEIHSIYESALVRLLSLGNELRLPLVDKVNLNSNTN